MLNNVGMDVIEQGPENLVAVAVELCLVVEGTREGLRAKEKVSQVSGPAIKLGAASVGDVLAKDKTICAKVHSINLMEGR